MLILVLVAELTVAWLLLNSTLLLAGTLSKFLPVIATAVPALPMTGVKLVMIGAPPEAATVKGVLLLAEPVGVVTLISPVMAPVGTLAIICVAVAELTAAVTPLNLMVFWLAVVLNPVPERVTVVFTGPLFGVNSMIETCDEGLREIERILPTASYS